MAQPAAANVQTQSGQRLLAQSSYAAWATEFKAAKDLLKQSKHLQDLKDHVDNRTGEHPDQFAQEIVGGILLPRLQQDAIFLPTHLENKNRLTCIETLERMNRTEHLRPLLPTLFQTLIGILERDTEEMAAVALRILVEMHRSPGFDTEAPAFLEVVKRAHQRLPVIVQHLFTVKPPPPATSAPQIPATQGAAPTASMTGGDAAKKDGAPQQPPPNEPKLRADMSLKLLTETHTSFLLLFKQLPHIFNLNEWLTLMVNTLQFVPPENAISINRTHYSDLILAQSKTLSLVVSVLAMVLQRKEDQHLNAKITEIVGALHAIKHVPSTLVAMLRNSPPEAVSTRKDIINSMRNLLTAQSNYTQHQTAMQQQTTYNSPAITNPGWGELWQNFQNQLDYLLDENITVGPGRTAHETLRSFVWSSLAEFINQFRNKLTLPQLTRVIGIYGRNIHDPTLPAATVSFSLRLLSKLCELIVPSDSQEAPLRGQLLAKILDICANKLGSLKKQLPAVLLAAAQADQKAAKDSSSEPNPTEGSATSSYSSGMDGQLGATSDKKDVPEKTEEEKIAAEDARWAAALEAARESALATEEKPTPANQLHEIRTLVNLLITVLKVALQSLTGFRYSHRPAKHILVEDTYIMNRMLRNLIRCLTSYDTPKLPEKTDETSNASNQMQVDAAPGSASSASSSKEGKSPYVPSTAIVPQLRELFDKDCMTSAMMLFTIDPNVLEDLISHNMSYIYQSILEYPFLISFLHVLISQNLGNGQRPYVRNLNDIVLNFFVTKIPSLPTADTKEANILQRMFKHLFGVLGQMIDDPPFNPSWAPILSGVVTQVLRLATETKDPLSLFSLLRNLFKYTNPSNSKVEVWSKELAHSLPTIVDTINRIQENTSSQMLKDILVELPLVLPVKLSAMLPCFKLFLKPLLAALESPDTDAYAGTKCFAAIRFMEIHMSSFAPDFLEPLIADVKPRLLRALWRHVRQQNTQFTSQVLRLLGRLGGRIRPYAIPPHSLSTDDASTLTLALSFDTPAQIAAPVEEPASKHNVPTLKADPTIERTSRVIELPLLDSITSARRILFLTLPPTSSSSASMNARKLNAFNFLKATLHALMRPYVDTPAPTKHLKLYGAEDIATLDTIDPSNPVRLVTKPQYPAFVTIADPVASISGASPKRTKTVRNLESEQHAIKFILSSLITAASTESLRAVANELLEQVCAHFALLYVTHTTPNPANLQELDPVVLIDAITDVLTSENRDHAAGALTTIDLLLDACFRLDPDAAPPKEERKPSSDKKSATSASAASSTGSASGEKDELNEGPATPFLLGLPMLSQLLQRLCDVSFKREWFYKAGGSVGLKHLLARMPTGWIRHNQVTLLQAILLVVKDYPLGATISVTDEASQTFLKALQASNAGNNQMGELPQADTLSFLASQLSCTNPLVRKMVQNALDKLAEWSGSEVSELLEPHKHLIMEPILAHPLSRLAPKLQHAYFDTIAYCLNLRPPIIPEVQALKSFFTEALTFAESEDTLRNLLLATALVDALAAAVAGWKPFQTAENMELRTKTIAMFLRMLTGANRTLIASAKKGLEQLVASDLLVRKTLIDTVSPLLTQFNNGKLTEHMLEGLARVVLLSPKVFTLEFGKKLLDHLGPFAAIAPTDAAAPGSTQAPAGQPAEAPALPKLEPGESPFRVTAAVMEICHLLPFANKYLDRMVDLTLKLETRSPLWNAQPGHGRRFSPKELTSPYRAPLAKFLNRMPAEAIAFFFAKLQDPEHSTLFVRMLKSEHAPALREELRSSSARLIDAAFSPPSVQTPEDLFQVQFAGIMIVKTLLKFYPDWLIHHKDVLTKLHLIWNHPSRLERLQNEASLSHRHSRETTYLIRIFVRYLRQNHHDSALFFDLMTAFITPHCNETVELTEFYHTFVPEHYTMQEQRALFERVVADFGPAVTNGYSIPHKQCILKMFVLRIFEVAVEKGYNLLTKELFAQVMPNFFSSTPGSGVRNALAYELVTLLDLMLQSSSGELEDSLKDLIKFGWAYQRNEDSYTRQASSHLFSRIIKDRTTIAPRNIRIMVYATLMRSYQTEVRATVRESLNILVPVVLDPNSTTPDSQYVKWTRKALYDESQIPQQLYHLLYVLARFEPNFRPWRMLFYPALASSFPKLMPHSYNTPSEQRKLAIAVIELLLTWERLRIKNEETKPDATPAPAIDAPAPPATTSENKPPVAPSSNAMDVTETPAEATPASATSAAPAAATPSSTVSVAPTPTVPTATSNAPAIPSTATPEAPALDYGDGKLHHSQIEAILNTLLSASVVVDPTARSSGSHGASKDLSFVFMRLLKEALTVWPNANMKINFLFSRVLDKPDNASVSHARALFLLDTVFRTIPSMIVTYAQELARCLPPLIALETPDTNRALCQLLGLLLTKYPVRVPGGPLEPLYQGIMSELEKSMAEKPVDNVLAVLKVMLRPVPATSDASKPTDVANPVKIEEKKDTTEQKPADQATQPTVTVKSENAMEVDAPTTEAKPDAPAPAEEAAAEPDLLGPLVPSLLKLAFRLRDLVLAKPEQPDPTGAPPKRPDPAPLFAVLNLLAPRLSGMPIELRRQYLATINILFEKAVDEPFVLTLLSLVEPLVFDVREASALLQRLRRFDQKRTGPIGEAYFKLIYKFYEQFKITEMPTLEPAFLSVLTVRDSSVRAKFIDKFAARLPTGFAPRFEALLRPQTWESFPNLFWIQPCLEILMNQADYSLPATLGCLTARLPQPKYASQPAKGSRAQSQSANATFDAEKAFLDSLNTLTVGDLLRPLSDLLYQDLELASTVWSSFFTGVVNNDASGALRRKVWQHLQALLSQDAVSRGQRLLPLVAQALLRALHKTSLHMPPSLIKYVGSTYHAWHMAIHILEERIAAGLSGTSPDAPAGVVVTFPNHPPALYQALSDLYGRLYEDDFVTAIMLNQSVMDDTRAGLILQQQGAFARAQEVYYQALHDSSKGLIENVPEQEQSLWETQWIECAKRLNQWDVVASYAKSVGSVELAADAAWKLGDWEGLKDALGKFPTTDSPKLALLQVYSTLADRGADVDHLHIMNLILVQWLNLPRIPCAAYTPLLCTLQRFIDAHESTKMVKDMKQDPIQRIHELRNTHFKVWRERLPHECDDILLWHDVLQWRQHIFTIIAQTVMQVPNAQSTTSSVLGLPYHEAAWTINTMSHVARKQGLIDICLTSLPRIYELPNIEVTEAFSKVCEHMKCYFSLPLPHTRGILDIINSTNLNYFTPTQKAEFFHLKAEYLARTGALEEAAKAYSTSVLIYPSLPKVWTGWGAFYDERFEALMGTSAILASTQNEVAVANGAPSSATPSIPAASVSEVDGASSSQPSNATPSAVVLASNTVSSSPKSRLTAAHYALSCYLLAMRANPKVSSRKMIGRVLWLLGYDDELSGEEVAVLPTGMNAPSTIGASAVIPSTPATPSLNASTTIGAGMLNPSAMDVSAPEGTAENLKKREATTSPSADDDRNPKRRKLGESADGEAMHQLESATENPSGSQSTKMDVDAPATNATSAPPSTGGDTKPLMSSLLVPPTPNTPATPSAYMVAATPMTPGQATLPPPSTPASSSSAPAPPDPVLVEINRVRKSRHLCTTFLEHMELLPAWLWLPWIPQLLSGLDRPEALAMQTVLKKVARTYPHGLFFPLYSWIAERKQLLSSNAASSSSMDISSGSTSLSTERMALRLAEDVMAFMREKQPSVAADLERMTTELEQLAALTLPEALMDAFNAIISTNLDVSSVEGNKHSAEERRTRLSMQLQLIHQYIFEKTELSSSSAGAAAAEASGSMDTPRTRKSRGKKADTSPAEREDKSGSASPHHLHPMSKEALRARLLPKFEEDFGAWLNQPVTELQQQQKRPSIRLTTLRLRSWVSEMRSLISALPTWLELHKTSWLSQFQNENTLEMPGIYLEDKEMSPDTSVFVDKFESPIKISKSHGLPRRILTIRGSNGQFYHWFVQSTSGLPVSLAHIQPVVSSFKAAAAVDGILSLSSSTRIPAFSSLASSSSKVAKPAPQADLDATQNKPTQLAPLPFNLLWSREARFAQLIRLVTRLTQKEVHVRKRTLPVTASYVIQLSPTLRLVGLLDKDLLSLDDAVEDWHRKNASLKMDVQSLFDDCLGGRKNEDTLSAAAAFSIASKQRLMQYEAARHATSDDALKDMLESYLGEHYEGIWHVRKAFMGYLAQFSLLQFLFSSTLSATPEHLTISPSTGRVQLFDFAPALNGNGALQTTPAVPFRLTPNILRILGPALKGSLYEAVLTACTISLSRQKSQSMLTQHLQLYIRDDLLELLRHNVYKSSQVTELNLLNPTSSVQDTLKSNLQLITSRLEKVAPPSMAAYRPNTTVAINAELDKLVDAALDPTLASKMPISWASWM